MSVKFAGMVACVFAFELTTTEGGGVVSGLGVVGFEGEEEDVGDVGFALGHVSLCGQLLLLLYCYKFDCLLFLIRLRDVVATSVSSLAVSLDLPIS